MLIKKKKVVYFPHVLIRALQKITAFSMSGVSPYPCNHSNLGFSSIQATPIVLNFPVS